MFTKLLSSRAALISATAPVLEALESRQLLHAGFAALVDFAPQGTTPPVGWHLDSGQTYADRGNGFTYGWDADNSPNTRERDSSRSPSALYDSLIHMQKNDANRTWQLAVEDGWYDVTVDAGDANYTDSVYKIDVEGQRTIDGTPTSSHRWLEGTQRVLVTDGKLTISSAAGAINNKLNFVDVEQADVLPNVSITASDPHATETGNTGAFTVTRDGDPDEPLDVYYTIAGTASNGLDYKTIASHVTIPADESSAIIHIHPLLNGEGDDTINLTLLSDDSYNIVSKSNSATVNIIDDAVHALSTVGSSPFRVNFQPSSSSGVDFYKTDYGAKYGLRSNGYTYGWDFDNTANTRDKNSSLSPDQRYDTLIHMQRSGNDNWNLAVPNGTYTVRVVAGDAGFTDSVFKINVEGVLTVNGTPTSSNHWVEGTSTVNVTDGKLTISNASGASNNKIDFVEILKGSSKFPVVGVNATDSTASESGPSSGRYSITRMTNDWSQPLVVNYTLTGTARNGVDYQSLSGSATIAAGQPSVSVVVNPIDDTSPESTESVVLTLTATDTYSNASNAHAQVNISDNDAAGSLSWKTVASSPVARSEGMGAVVGGKLYTFGGYSDSKYRPLPTVEVYDPATNKWTQKKDMPQRLTHAGTTTDGTFIYMAGGYPGLPNQPQTFSTTNVWKYDPANDSWTTIQALPSARGAGSLQYLNHTLYFFGGADSNRADRAEMWTLDLSTSGAEWVQRASLPAARNHVGGAALNGKIYAVGGQTGQDNASVFKSDVWSYDPSTNKWTTVASLINQPRSHIANATFVQNGKILTLGGEGPGRVALNNVEQYDPSTNKWTSLKPLPQIRSSGVAATFGDEIIFTTGYNGAFKADTWLGTFA
jgi:N-acetylneuraminic acid mutarotase